MLHKMRSCRVALLFSLVGCCRGTHDDVRTPKSVKLHQKGTENGQASPVLAVQDEGTMTEDVHEQMWGVRPMSLVETTSNETTSTMTEDVHEQMWGARPMSLLETTFKETTVKLDILETNGPSKIQLSGNTNVLYSEGQSRGAPCVVFFPGDLSDLEVNTGWHNQQLVNALPQLLPGQPFTEQLMGFVKDKWSLEGIHRAIAARFPKSAVVTFRGQLDGIKRSYPYFTDNANAVPNLKLLLSQIVDPSSRLVVVGFSRGGEALSGLINGASADLDFWRRVDGIYFVDCGGSSFNTRTDGFNALRKGQSSIQLYVEWTGYPHTMASDGQRKSMIKRAVEQAGLSVFQKGYESLKTFSDHMNILNFFKR